MRLPLIVSMVLHLLKDMDCVTLNTKALQTTTMYPTTQCHIPEEFNFLLRSCANCQPCYSLYFITSQPQYLSIWAIPILNTCPDVSYPDWGILCFFSSLHANANIPQTIPWPLPFVSLQVDEWSSAVLVPLNRALWYCHLLNHMI